MKIFYRAPSPRSQSESATARRSRHYPCVAIRYYGDGMCPAMMRFKIKPNLSNKAPPFLETQRFLSNEAPLLPLLGCMCTYCQCRYVHYDDRRERDRRNSYSWVDPFIPTVASQERRLRVNRRLLSSARTR